MRRAGLLTITAAAVLLLAGCAQTSATEADDRASSAPVAAPSESSRQADADARAERERLNDQERLFLESARLAEPDWTDEQLLEVGYEYCAGPRSTDVIEGVDAIITYAADQALCPE